MFIITKIIINPFTAKDDCKLARKEIQAINTAVIVYWRALRLKALHLL